MNIPFSSCFLVTRVIADLDNYFLDLGLEKREGFHAMDC